MHNLLMDQKRTVNASRVSASGCTICRSGNFSIMLMNDGSYSIVNITTGELIASGLTKEDTNDLFRLCVAAKRWGNHHNVVK